MITLASNLQLAFISSFLFYGSYKMLTTCSISFSFSTSFSVFQPHLQFSSLIFSFPVSSSYSQPFFIFPAFFQFCSLFFSFAALSSVSQPRLHIPSLFFSFPASFSPRSPDIHSCSFIVCVYISRSGRLGRSGYMRGNDDSVAADDASPEPQDSQKDQTNN